MQLAEKMTTVPANSSICIRIENLSASYRQNEPVLSDVSLNIYDGEAVALLGHNGSGKSTLIRCLMGQMKTDSGNIEMFDTRMSEASRSKQREVRRRIGVVYQKHNLIPRLSVLSNVIHGALAFSHSPLLWYHTTAPVAIRNQAMEVLEKVGLAPFAARKASALSGGQSQRVALARALMQKPDCILADEPVASLDPQAGEEIMTLLKKLCKEQGVALVFSTHHLEHALQYADSIVALKQGCIFTACSAADASLEQLRKIYE